MWGEEDGEGMDATSIRFDRPTVFLRAPAPAPRVDVATFRRMVAARGVDVSTHAELVRRAHADLSTSHPVEDGVVYVLSRVNAAEEAARRSARRVRPRVPHTEVEGRANEMDTASLLG